LTNATQIGIVKRQSLLSYVTKLALSEGTSATLCNKFESSNMMFVTYSGGCIESGPPKFNHKIGIPFD